MGRKPLPFQLTKYKHKKTKIMISKYGKKVMGNAGVQNRLESLQKWCDKITGTIQEELGEDWENCEVATEFERICASVEQLKQLFE